MYTCIGKHLDKNQNVIMQELMQGFLSYKWSNFSGVCQTYKKSSKVADRMFHLFPIFLKKYVECLHQHH